MPDKPPSLRRQPDEHPGMWYVRVLWCLPEIILLSVLVFICVMYGIKKEEILYHSLFSLSTFAAIRCVESVIRVEERAIECEQFARACRIIHLRPEEYDYEDRLQDYRFKHSVYGIFAFLTLCWWIVGAIAYVYVLKSIHAHTQTEAVSMMPWLNRIVGFGTAFFVISAIVKSGLAVRHDKSLNVAHFAQLARERFPKNKGGSADTGS